MTNYGNSPTVQSPTGTDGRVLVSTVPGLLPVAGAVCTGATTLSAFHRALEELGLGHYNLVRLSSVIPPGAVVVHDVPFVVDGAWGDRLYCVYAEQRTSTPGEEAWAGVGWVQRLDGKGGLLVEHEGGSEGFVTDAVLASLEDMVTGSEFGFTEPELFVVGGRCTDKPVTALVMVPFATVSWGS